MSSDARGARLSASEPSPAPEPRPASRTGPTGPILRANPYPEVTDLICRLPLPTLVYRPEASYLGDRLRIWVRTGPKLGCAASGAGPRALGSDSASPGRPPPFAPCSYLPRMFHGPAVVRGTPQEPRRSTADRFTNTLSHCEWLLGSRRLKQKRKLFPGPPPMDASWFPLPGSCTWGRPASGTGPRLASRPGYGISTVFPFATNSRRQLRTASSLVRTTTTGPRAASPAGLERSATPPPSSPLFWPLPLAWDKALALGLGATNPCPTDVHMEPFSTSAFKGVSLDYLLLPPRSAPGAAPGRLTPDPFSAHPCDPPTRRGLETWASPSLEREAWPVVPPAVEYRENALAPYHFKG